MINETSGLTVAGVNNQLTQRLQTDAILSCNEITSVYGLTLTERQAAALAETCLETLQKTGRIELGESAVQKLILRFCDSPYLSKDNYEAALHELIELFYNFKNDVSDSIGDDLLINYMKQNFDGVCHGSLELLADNALPLLVRKINECRLGHPFEITGAGDE